jgi:hypothetical protein
MSWIEAIADFLEEEDFGVKGTTIFIGQRPDITGVTILLTEYDGTIMETFRGPIALYQPSLQVRVAGEPEDYATPRDTLKDVQTALAAITNQDLGGIHFKRIKPSTTILSLGQDDVLSFEFSANFEVTYAD